MRKYTLNNYGFGLIGILIIIVVLVLVGGTSVYIYRQDHKKPAAVSTRVTYVPSTKASPKSTVTNVQPTDPFFTCFTNNGVISKAGPTTCTTQAGKTYPLPTTYTTADVINYNKIPAGAQPLVSALAEKTFNACVKTSPPSGPTNGIFPYTSATIVAQNFVSVGVWDCDSGYSEDFGLQSATWNDLGSRQIDIKCSTIAKYGITRSEVIVSNARSTYCTNADGTQGMIPQ